MKHHAHTSDILSYFSIFPLFFVLHLFYIRLFIILSSNTEKFNYKEDWWYW